MGQSKQDAQVAGGQQKSTSFLQDLADFSNVLKAFVGTTFLMMPFGLSRAGIVAALSILTLIIALNTHCCHLIIRCKVRIIDRIVEERRDELGGVSGDAENRLRHQLNCSISYSDIGFEALGRFGKLLVDYSLLFTQTMFCLSYLIFIGNTVSAMFPCDIVSLLENGSLIVEEPSSYALVSSAPDLRILVAIPAAVLSLTCLIRKLRHIAPITMVSVVATAAAFGSLYFYFIINFDSSALNSVSWFVKPSTVLVFFGQVVCAFEGIGLVIPLHASMVGNRHLFRRFLVVSLVLIAFIYASFGVVGYLRYGDSTRQAVNTALPSDNWFTLFINVSLVVAIFLSFPMQFFPVAQILEGYLFAAGCVFGPSKEESKALLKTEHLEKDSGPSETGTAIVPSSVAAWKRNCLRLAVLVVMTALAILMRNYFAYLNAIIGAVGSAPLAYIFPCLFHLKLRYNKLLIRQIIKDYFVIVFGLAGGVASLLVTVNEILNSEVEAPACSSL